MWGCHWCKLHLAHYFFSLAHSQHKQNGFSKNHIFIYYFFIFWKKIELLFFLDILKSFYWVCYEGLQLKYKKCLPLSLFLLMKSYLIDSHSGVYKNSFPRGGFEPLSPYYMLMLTDIFKFNITASILGITKIKAWCSTRWHAIPFLLKHISIDIADQTTMQKIVTADYPNDSHFIYK